MTDDKDKVKKRQPPPPEPNVEWYPSIPDDVVEAARKKAVEEVRAEQTEQRRYGDDKKKNKLA